MVYVGLGALAFLIACLFDLAAVRGIPYLKQASGALVVLLFTYALIAAALYPDKLPLPGWPTAAGWLLSAVFGFLLLYSLFLEIPFQRTYAADGAGDELVKTGTYALVRHPGVLWLTGLLLALVLASRSRLLLLAVPVWVLLDVLYVWVQERFFFHRQFAGYVQYQQETPMLIPTRASVGRCWRTVGRRGRD
ncbi:MAG TPA: methyltransferase [Anaerolineae bacterium]|nr:methyltransferase [Anaerolineae bacterium]